MAVCTRRASTRHSRRVILGGPRPPLSDVLLQIQHTPVRPPGCRGRGGQGGAGRTKHEGLVYREMHLEDKKALHPSTVVYTSCPPPHPTTPPPFAHVRSLLSLHPLRPDGGSVTISTIPDLGAYVLSQSILHSPSKLIHSPLV
jgi:hypothetical protein